MTILGHPREDYMPHVLHMPVQHYLSHRFSILLGESFKYLIIHEYEVFHLLIWEWILLRIQWAVSLKRDAQFVMQFVHIMLHKVGMNFNLVRAGLDFAE